MTAPTQRCRPRIGGQEATMAHVTNPNRRRQRLLADLQRLSNGWRPSENDLASAPLLQDWYLALYPGSDDFCLCGRVSGHPRLPDGVITTSPIMAADFVAGGWARPQRRRR
jgi:hypothetical protein